MDNVFKHNDFAYGWARNKDVDSVHNHRVVMASEYIAALEERVGPAGQNQIREKLGLPLLPVYEETDVDGTQ